MRVLIVLLAIIGFLSVNVARSESQPTLVDEPNEAPETYWQQAFTHSGHTKYRLQHNTYPSDSAWQPITGSHLTDHAANLRYNLKWKDAAWSAEANYELGAYYAQSLDLSAPDVDQPLPELGQIPSDKYRIMNLTSVIVEQGKTAVVHRLDRLELAYQSANNVLKLGRQAISWGNGMVFSPMDFFNPFDPAAIDKEYKTGDDMLYGQRLFNSGNDLQFVWVGRRDNEGNASAQVDSIAAKYHAFMGAVELDVLVAEHYQDKVLGVGGIYSVAGGVVRGDVVWVNTPQQSYTNVVGSYSYSWVGLGKNMSGLIEYFHNDFGIASGEYDAQTLASHPDLLRRLLRGETFTLAQDYLAVSVLTEMSALWLLTPNVFYNLNDRSALIQLVSQHNLSQNSQAVIAVNLPLGDNGSEYGGIPVTKPPLGSVGIKGEGEQYLRTGWSLFAQYAWYF